MSQRIKNTLILQPDRHKDLSPWLIPAAVFFIILFVNLPLANTELMSPDASGYLDMGRNLFSGKGMVISYNLYQFWPGKYHPMLPYMQPLYSIVAGLLLFLFNLKAVIGFNILLLAINCVLLYKIIRINFGFIESALISLIIGFSTNLVFSSIYPWTEQLHLLTLLLALYMYIRYEKASFAVGVMLAISCLVRAAGIYNVIAFGFGALAAKGFSRDAFKGYLHLAAGFLSIFITYEAACYLFYRAVYPQYLLPSKIYRAAELIPGAFYKDAIPVLNLPPLAIDTRTALVNMYKHVNDIMNNFGNFKFVWLAAPVFLLYEVFRRRDPFFAGFVFQGVGVTILYAWSFSWLPEIEALRYSLIPFAMLVSAGLLYIKQLLENFVLPGQGKKYIGYAFTALLVIMLGMEIKSYAPFRHYYKDVYPSENAGYLQARNEMYIWIRENTDRDALLASYFLGDIFLCYRPFVSMPSGKAATEQNIRNYMDIYKPDYVLLDTRDAPLSQLLSVIGFIEKKRSGSMVLFGRM